MPPARLDGPTPLNGTVVVVPLGANPAPLIKGLAEAGATMVLVAPEGDPEPGRLAAQLPGTRAAVFTASGDSTDVDALVEMIGELFANRP